MPVNQADMAATTGFVSATFLHGTLVLGIPHTPADAPAVMHLGRWMGRVMGVDEDLLHERPRRALRAMCHFLRTSPPPDENSVVLAEALLDPYGMTDFPRLAALRRRLDIARHRATAAYLNGPPGCGSSGSGRRVRRRGLSGGGAGSGQARRAGWTPPGRSPFPNHRR